MHTVKIRLQSPVDTHEISRLHQHAFGPGRFARSAYRVREGSTTDARLNLCAVCDTIIIGAVQFTPISIGGVDRAVLLGPLVIDDAFKNQGFGLQLMLDGMGRARQAGYRLVILVGDPPYYARAGFIGVPPGAIIMPAPVDPARLLYAELIPNAIQSYAGEVRGCLHLM